MIRVTAAEARRMGLTPGRSKFNVAMKGTPGYQARIYRGTVYDSAAEAAMAGDLDMRVRAAVIKSWQRQVPFSLAVNGQKIATYKADFLVRLNDFSQEVFEVKGVATGTWRLKEKLFRALYPEIKLTVVKVK